MSSKCKQFDAGIDKLQARLAPEEETSTVDYVSVSHLLPTGWQCKKHDRGLLRIVAKNGFSSLLNLPSNKEYGFEDMTLENLLEKLPENSLSDVISMLTNRVEEICQIFKEQ